MPYDYVTRGQIERTNELIVENNELLSDINNTLDFGFTTLGFILVLAIIYKVTRHVLGVRNG